MATANNGVSSQQDVRQLCHILAALNYDGQQTLVMPESFARPNFDLVCDILIWFARIVDDKYVLTMTSEFAGFMLSSRERIRLNEAPDSSRMAFLVDLAKLFAAQLGIHLNLVSLYQADETSCPELLKIAEPIYKAAQLAVGDNNSKLRLNESQVSKKLTSLAATMKSALDLIGQDERKEEEEAVEKRPVALALETSKLLGELERLLANEESFNEERKQVMERRLELVDIEQVLRNAYDGIVAKTRELAQGNDELEKDLTRLDERLSIKEMEVNGAREKLNNLLVQAPTYVHQYGRLRNQYELAYENYVSKFRSLMYLKSCVYSTSLSSLAINGAESYELTKPGGSPAGAVGDAAGATAATGELAAGLGPGSGTTGPARLLESLLDGTSNPMSTSAALGDSGAETGPRVSGGGLGRGAAATEAGAAGLARYDWRPAVAGDATGLELEGLLNEFVADEDEPEEVESTEDGDRTGLVSDSDDEEASTDDEDDDDDGSGAGAG